MISKIILTEGLLYRRIDISANLLEMIPDFVVRNVECVQCRGSVVILDGDVAALIEQGQDAFHPFCRSIEGGCQCASATYFRRHDMELPQHLDEICRSARTKPIICVVMVLERVEKTKRIVDVG